MCPSRNIALNNECLFTTPLSNTNIGEKVVKNIRHDIGAISESELRRVAGQKRRTYPPHVVTSLRTVLYESAIVSSVRSLALDDSPGTIGRTNALRENSVGHRDTGVYSQNK